LFRSNLRTELASKFDSVLDTNYKILGVRNGVLEAIDENILFRDAKPEDYISMSTNVSYNSDFTWEHDRVRECMSLFRSLLTKESSLHNFLKIMSSTLVGIDGNKMVHTFKGTDANLKMIIILLLRQVYGDYYVSDTFDLPLDMYYTLKGKRVAFHSCDDEHSLVKMHVKMIIGGDSFYGLGKEVKIAPLVFLTYNDTINIPDCDMATIKRINLIQVTGSSSDPEIYNLISASAFLWIMTQYYPFYVKEGLEFVPVDPKDIISTRNPVISDPIVTSNTITPETTISDGVTPGTDRSDTVTLETTTSDGVIPETTTSDSVTPGTSTPHSVTPETTTSDGVTPGTDRSDTVTLETTTSDSVTPGTSTSHSVTSETTTSDSVTSETTTSDSVTSETTTSDSGDTVTPETTTSDGVIPETTTSDTVTPETTTSDGVIPETTTSDTVTPEMPTSSCIII
jgi:hypothetical protein